MIPLNSYQVRISGNVSPTATSSKLKEIPKTNESLQGPHSVSNRHWRLFLESQGVTNLIKLPRVFRSCWTTKKHTARKLQFHSKKSNHLFQPRDCNNLLQAQFWLGFFWYKKKIRNHHSNHCCHLSSRRCIPHGQR